VASSDWYQEVRDQNDYLRKQLVALHRGPRARWIKFRLLEVVCRDSGDAIVEVMATDPYPVIRYRRTEDHPSTSTPSGASVAERIAHIGERLPPIRRGEWMFYPSRGP
jgi:hypothetical protein